MLLVCSWSFHAPGQVPVGVGFVVPPWVIGTGPRSTTPFVISHACFVDRLTHARISGPHGGGGGGGSDVSGTELAVLPGNVEPGGPPGAPMGLSCEVGAGPATACAAQPDNAATASRARPASSRLMPPTHDVTAAGVACLLDDLHLVAHGQAVEEGLGRGPGQVDAAV